MELLNRQKIKNLNQRKIQKYLKEIFSRLALKSKKASFVLCDNLFISRLNQEYFNKSAPTDVISFPLADESQPDYLGEVVVSVEEAVLTAEKLNLDWQRELLLYLIHGILHLIGFRDKESLQKKEMEKKQTEILANFKKVELS